jgi:hypothetical protein
MDRMKDLLSFFIAAMAMVALLCAIYEAMNQRTASALALATIFLLSTLNAKVTYMTIAWGNRLGSPKYADKQHVLDDMDAQLSALNVTERERRQLAKPLVALIGVDLYSVYSQVMERLVFWKNTIESRALNANASPEAKAAFQKLTADIAAWRQLNTGKTPGNDLDNYDLGGYLIRDTPVAILSDPQKGSAEALRNQILTLYRGCVEKGGYTPEAAAFLDENIGENYVSAADAKVKELFGLAVETGPAH